MDDLTFMRRGIIGFLVGFFLILPGMSGATFLLSINGYDSIINNISNIFKDSKKSLLYLFPIVVGVVIGLILGFFILKILLKYIPLETIYLFSGFILGSIPSFYRNNIKKYNYKYSYITIIGILLPLIILFISFKSSINKELSLSKINIIIYIILGLVISLTQILPGLSATTFLVSVGYFTPLLNNVNNIFNNKSLIFIYLIIVISFIIFFFLFSKLISKLLSNKDKKIYYLMFGMLISSFISMLYNLEIKDIISNINSDLLINKIFLAILSLILGFIISLNIGKE